MDTQLQGYGGLNGIVKEEREGDSRRSVNGYAPRSVEADLWFSARPTMQLRDYTTRSPFSVNKNEKWLKPYATRVSAKGG